LYIKNELQCVDILDGEYYNLPEYLIEGRLKGEKQSKRLLKYVGADDDINLET